MNFCDNTKLGTISKFINPSFEGCFKNIPMLKCEGTILSNDSSFTMNRQVSMNNIYEDRCLFSKFSTKSFLVKSLMIDEIMCYGACDGMHRTNCCCLKVVHINSIGIGLNFVSKECESIFFKHCFSDSVTKLFVHEDVIKTHFEHNRLCPLRYVR